MTGVFKKRGGICIQRQTCTDGRQREDTQRVIHLQVKEFEDRWQMPEAGRGQNGFFPRALREIMALLTP